MPPKIVSVEIKGTEEFFAAAKNIEKEGKRTIGQLLLEAATLTHKFAIDSIRHHKGSTTAIRYRPKRTVTVSPEGEAPNSDRGTLVENILLESIPGGYTVGSRKGAPWGFWLEMGTSIAGARPWLVPAFNKMMDAIRGKYG